MTLQDWERKAVAEGNCPFAGRLVKDNPIDWKAYPGNWSCGICDCGGYTDEEMEDAKR